MAPFAKKRGGRGGAQSNGRTKPDRNQRPKKTFYSTRVRDLEETGSESAPSSDPEDVTEDQSISDDSSDDEESAAPVIRPYSALLQSLNASTPSSGKPAKKKRKLDSGVPTPTGSAKVVLDNGTDTIEEQEQIDEADALDDEASSVASDGTDAAEADLTTDPFAMHLSGASEESVAEAVEEAKTSVWTPRKHVSKDGWRETFLGLKERHSRAVSGSVHVRSTTDMKLKNRIRGNAERLLPSLGNLDQVLSGGVFSYRDVLLCERTAGNAHRVRSLVSLHCLNHVLKTRDRVLKNSLKLAKAESEDAEYRDQGFTRPKVLFILPTRQACSKVVESILSFYEPDQQENKKRFQDSYHQAGDGIAEDRPDDFKELFVGNDDDMFRIGMKFTRKTVKFFAQFYNSDIIFASPLGLRMAIGAEGKKLDYDFLSSIEIVVVDHADALLMQNWDHVEFAFQNLNLQPKEAHGCDFGRVRNWYLDGHARYLRQTIITAAFNTPEINKIFTRTLCNIEGKVKISRDIYPGTISELGIQVRQTFARFDSTSPAADPDARFKYFTTTAVPNLDKLSRGSTGPGLGTVIFIPSYLDFVRVRNFLANDIMAQNIPFGSISEYSSAPETSRARSHFITGRHSVLLYTGRAHHFNRFRIRGSKNILFYSLPDNPIFYKEVAGEWIAKSISEGIVDPNDAAVRVLFSKWDTLKLERTVGSTRVGAMLKEKGGDTFEFL